MTATTPTPTAAPSTRTIYRWDLDKTYLQTDFDSLRSLVRTAIQRAADKRAIPGASTLIRELKANPGARICIVSGSPTQMRRVLTEKLRLDGVEFDEFVLKDNLRNLVRGRFKALKGQVGYKLPVLLESRARAPAGAEEVLFGDDSEADAFIYSLYADLLARRIDEPTLRRVLDAAEVYPDDAARIVAHWRDMAPSDPVRRIFIHLDRLTPPAFFASYGPRVVPVFNYFQAALVLMADAHLTAPQVVKVMLDMMGTAGHNLLTMSNSLQDLLRRGLPLGEVAEHLRDALDSAAALKGPAAVVNLVRPVPDILAAFSRRIAALGAVPAPPEPKAVDYLQLIDDARPRTHRGRRHA